jgi:hypothetical protein
VISIAMPPARMRSGFAVASPPCTRSTTCSILKAVRDHDRLGAAARQEASNSMARRQSGFGRRRRDITDETPTVIS